MDRITRDAEEFGRHVTAGGWQLGLLVARNVTPAKAGRPAKIVAPTTISKVSAREFAERAKPKTTADRVMRHLRAWDLAANVGVVPKSAELKPGDEVELPDDEQTPWRRYYAKTLKSDPDAAPPKPAQTRERSRPVPRHVPPTERTGWRERIEQYVFDHPGVKPAEIKVGLGAELKTVTARLSELNGKSVHADTEGRYWPGEPEPLVDPAAEIMAHVREVREFLDGQPLAKIEAVAEKFGWPVSPNVRRVMNAARLDGAVLTLIERDELPLSGIEALADVGQHFASERQAMLAQKIARGLVPLDGSVGLMKDRLMRLVPGDEQYISARAAQQFFSDATLSYEAAVTLGEEYLERERERKAEDRAMRARKLVKPGAVPTKIFQQLANVKLLLEELDEKGIIHPISQVPDGLERFCSELIEIARIASTIAQKNDPTPRRSKSGVHAFTVIDGDVG